MYTLTGCFALCVWGGGGGGRERVCVCVCACTETERGGSIFFLNSGECLLVSYIKVLRPVTYEY